ncbi:MAG: energy transducer TonB [Bacteroidales bacterium]|nr:energy transducer TonB [Bacteroidales bacterium]
MRTMPTPHANLEDKRTIFFEIGLIIALTIVLLSFNLKRIEHSGNLLNYNSTVNELEEMTAITQQEQTPPPPKPPAQTSVIQIVENETEEVSEEIEIDAEADQDTKVEEYVPYTPPEIEEEETVVEDQVFVVVEAMPYFPGGEEARIRYLNDNIKYPVMAREAGIEGTVYVTFVVEKDGSISKVKVLRGIGGGCDEEAMRVVEEMPKWNPGRQRNIPVRVQFNMPIRFILL